LAEERDDEAESEAREGSQSGEDHGHSSNAAGMSAPYTLLGAMFLGLGIGYLLDQHYQTEPRWMVGMTLLFLTAGMYQIIKDSYK